MSRIFVLAMMLAVAARAEAKPNAKYSDSQPTATTTAASPVQGAVPAVVPDEKQAAVLYKQAQDLLWSNNVNDVAVAAELFADSAALGQPQAMGRFNKALQMLREKNPDLAGKVVTKVVGKYGTGGFEKTLDDAYTDLRKGFVAMGFDPTKRYKNGFFSAVASLGSGTTGDCKSFGERLSLMADIASARGFDDAKQWKLHVIDNDAACDGSPEGLDRAYRAYMTAGDGESARATSLRRAEKLVERFLGKSPGNAWQTVDFTAARDAYYAANLTVADTKTKLEPVALEAEKSKRYDVAVEAYKAIGSNDAANALLPVTGGK